jgi:hypothetical protein
MVLQISIFILKFLIIRLVCEEDFLGEQYNDGYDDTAAGGDGEEEWTQYYDDDGNPYWYNNYSGISQYEEPY